MTLAKLKQQFITHLKTEKGSSAKTIENYNRYLTRFLDYVQLKSPADLTEKHVDEFRRHLRYQPGAKTNTRTRSMKQSTQNYYLIAVRAFLTYLHSVGVETFDPRLVSLGQVVRSSPDTISPAEVTRLLDAPDTSSLEGMRDRAILHLLCSTGVRVAELTNLDLKDIDMSQEECVVCSKHHEEKIVPLSDTTIDAIAMYVDNRSDHHDALFVRHGRKRNDGGDLRLAPRAVQRLVRHYAIVVGITTRVTPLTLRHSFAARLMSSGTDVRVIQSRLRHSSTAVTRGYISQQKTRREEDEVCE